MSRAESASECYAVFYSLAEAIQCARRHNIGLENESDRRYVFSRDKPNPKRPGAKTFVVATHQSLWQRLVRCRPRDRNFYEILLEHEPCHLYVDAEMVPAQQQRCVSPAQLDREFLEQLTQFLVQQGHVSDPATELEILTLQSSATYQTSNEEEEDRARKKQKEEEKEEEGEGKEEGEKDRHRKHSVHWVIRIRDHVWLNNYHCGALMRRFARWMQQQRTEYPHFFLHNGEFYADMGVYTRNRNFRLCYSSKRSDFRPLMPETGRANTRRVWDEALLDEHAFLQSLLMRVPNRDECTLLRTREFNGTEPGSTSDRVQFLAPGTSSSSPPLDLFGPSPSKPKAPLLPVPNQNQTSASTSWTLDGAAVPGVMHRVARLVQQDFIQRHCHAVGAPSYPCQTTVHCWRPAQHMLVLRSSLRACLLARRHHQNNQVFFVVDLLRRHYSQHCHDTTDCRRRRHGPLALDSDDDTLWDEVTRTSLETLFGRLGFGPVDQMTV